MPIKRASFKDLRKSKKRHHRNIAIKSELHSFIKKFENLVSAKKSDEAKALLASIISKINKAAAKGIIHKNASSRKVSRLTKKLALTAKA